MTRPILALTLILVHAPAAAPTPPAKLAYEPPPELMLVLTAILDAARQYGVDPMLAFNVAYAESTLKPWAIARRWREVGGKMVRIVTARGLMQINPKYQDELVAKLLGWHPSHFDWRNPVHSAKLGCAMLADFVKRYNGSREYACVAFNSGPFWADLSIRAPAVPLKMDTKKYLADIFGRA